MGRMALLAGVLLLSSSLGTARANIVSLNPEPGRVVSRGGYDVLRVASFRLTMAPSFPPTGTFRFPFDNRPLAWFGKDLSGTNVFPVDEQERGLPAADSFPAWERVGHAVPEPSTLTLACAGLVTLAAWRLVRQAWR